MDLLILPQCRHYHPPRFSGLLSPCGTTSDQSGVGSEDFKRPANESSLPLTSRAVLNCDTRKAESDQPGRSEGLSTHSSFDRVPTALAFCTICLIGRAHLMDNNRNRRTSSEPYTEWICQYCPSVATTIREGAAVCCLHRAQPRKRNWATRLLGGLLT